MQKTGILLAAGLIILPLSGYSAQTAQARMYCKSLRFQRGAAVDSVGFRWTMELSTLSAGINGELAPDFFNSGYSNSAYVELYSELLDHTFQGGMVLDIPDTGDTNRNGFLDFFEVSQAVMPITSAGAYNISGFGSGNVTATWSRDAGSALGYCFYSIPSSYGTLDFAQAFELIEYTGTLSYSPGATNVAASLSLTETNTGNTLEGPVAFVKSATNRFNKLTLQTAFLTNTTPQTLSLYETTAFLRRTVNPTNYFGPVEFNDGDFGTLEDDYYSWVLSIDDLNDADHDGIPDFSDDVGVVSPPRRPSLSLTRGLTNVLITIGGDVGHLHEIQASGSVTSTNWPTVLSVTLTNDPQVVSLPLPANGIQFWRAQAR
jgi:hypothetical protein